MVKKPVLILLFLTIAIIAKAEKNDTTIYWGCKIKNDTTTYVGSKINQSTNPSDCIVDSYPKFPGGDKAFYRFLAKNLKWPKTDIDVQGRVIITVVVEKDGHIDHFLLQRRLSPLFDVEALKVLKLSPRWIPAKMNGKPVRVRYFIPISFKPNN